MNDISRFRAHMSLLSVMSPRGYTQTDQFTTPRMKELAEALFAEATEVVKKENTK